MLDETGTLLTLLKALPPNTKYLSTQVEQMLRDQPPLPNEISRYLTGLVETGQLTYELSEVFTRHLNRHVGTTQHHNGMFNANEVDRSYLKLSQQISRALGLSQGTAPHELPIDIAVVEPQRPRAAQYHPGLSRNISIDPMLIGRLPDHAARMSTIASAGLPNAHVRLTGVTEGISPERIAQNADRLQDVANSWSKKFEDVHAMNQSYGFLFSDPREEAADLASDAIRSHLLKQADFPVSIAAGNSNVEYAGDKLSGAGPLSIVNQALHSRDDHVGVVSNIDPQGNKSDMSSYGSGVNFAAPGTFFVPKGHLPGSNAQWYELDRGTSLSSAYVTRTIATLRSLDPSLSGSDGFDLLFETRDAPTSYRVSLLHDMGFGRHRSDGQNPEEHIDNVVRAHRSINPERAQRVAAMTRLLRGGLSEDQAANALKLDVQSTDVQKLLSLAKKIIATPKPNTETFDLVESAAEKNSSSATANTSNLLTDAREAIAARDPATLLKLIDSATQQATQLRTTDQRDLADAYEIVISGLKNNLNILQATPTENPDNIASPGSMNPYGIASGPSLSNNLNSQANDLDIHASLADILVNPTRAARLQQRFENIYRQHFGLGCDVVLAEFKESGSASVQIDKEKLHTTSVRALFPALGSCFDGITAQHLSDLGPNGGVVVMKQKKLSPIPDDKQFGLEVQVAGLREGLIAITLEPSNDSLRAINLKASAITSDSGTSAPGAVSVFAFHAIAQLRKLGVSEYVFNSEGTMAGANGAHVWPLFGFDGVVPNTMIERLRHPENTAWLSEVGVQPSDLKSGITTSKILFNRDGSLNVEAVKFLKQSHESLETSVDFSNPKQVERWKVTLEALGLSSLLENAK
ncbi:MAG: S8 family serine peptidase [Casimicrobium sp.]